MNKLLLFSILGMIFLIGIISAGVLVAYDSYRDKPLDKADSDVLQRANITEYKVERIDKGDTILIKINNYNQVIKKVTKCYEMNILDKRIECSKPYKSEEEIQKEITSIENSWLQRQKDTQVKKESTEPKAPEIKTTELVTIKEGKTDEIGAVKLK
jgi:hypothetical protein